MRTPRKQQPPFKSLTKGMHRDKDIEVVPFDYLEWCMNTWSSEDDPANFEVVEEEYLLRKKGVRRAVDRR